MSQGASGFKGCLGGTWPKKLGNHCSREHSSDRSHHPNS